MNNRCYFFLFSLLFLLPVISGTETHTSDRTISIDLNNKNKNKLNNKSTATSDQEQKSHKTKKIKTKKLSQSPVVPPESYRTSISWRDKHFIFNMTTKKAMVVGMGVTYVSMVAALYAMHYTCQHYCRWAHWNNVLSTRQLRELPERELAKALFAELNTTYQHEDKQGDFLTPLVCFINAVDREITLHNRFLALHFWLDYCLIFPKQKIAQRDIAEQHERLKLIRSILVAWLTNYTNDDIQHVVQ